MKTCLIIAGGELQEEFASSYIRQKYMGHRPDLIIAADHGICAAKRLGIKPDIILGDYDSVDSESLQSFLKMDGIQNLQFPPEKDYTDSHLAVSVAMKQGAQDILLLAATGTRLDHVQANIGLLKTCVDSGVAAALVDSHNRIRICKDHLLVERQGGFYTYVSLIPYSDVVTGITLKGFRYPLEEATFSKNTYRDVENDMGASRGISNELIEEEGVIQIKEGYLLVMESRD